MAGPGSPGVDLRPPRALSRARKLAQPPWRALALLANWIRTRLALRISLLVVGVTLAAGLLGSLGLALLARHAAREPLGQGVGVLGWLRFGMVCLTLVLGLVLAFVLNRALVRPIVDLSRRLRQREAATGAPLVPPIGHEEDEIGRLAVEVNALVGRLEQALGQEQERSGRLTRDQRKSQAILEHADAGLFVVRGDGTLETWTPAFCRLLGLGPGQPDPEIPFHLLFGSASIPAEICLRTCQAEQARQVAILQLTEPDGQGHRWLKLTLERINPDWIQGQLEDITSYRDDAMAAEELAIRDPLTGAFNRLGAERALQERLAPSRGPMAVMLLDLDRFKPVNDTYGHAAGDEVLREVAARMKAGLRHSDVLARLGGDEFLIVVDAIQTEDAARTIARNLIQALNQPIHLPGLEPIQIGASLGIAFGGGPEPLTRAALLKRADQAMYEAKQAGRNRFQFYR